MDTEQISYRTVVAEVKKYRICALFISVTVWVTFMVIILFIRSCRMKLSRCRFGRTVLHDGTSPHYRFGPEQRTACT